MYVTIFSGNEHLIILLLGTRRCNLVDTFKGRSGSGTEYSSGAGAVGADAGTSEAGAGGATTGASATGAGACAGAYSRTTTR